MQAKWLGILFSGLALASALGAPPNIVFILADDLGYGDVGCYGCTDTRTPNIDRLAQEGVRLTSFYANAPECTPTRTGFMTGRYQHRVGGLECALGTGNVGRYDDAIRLCAQHEMGLPASETSVARMLKDAGYATAITGKWHLGYEPKFFPKEHGFDHWFGPIGGGMDYFYHSEPEGLYALYLEDKPVKREGYITDLITEEAVKYVNQASSQPFFLYVPFTAPHTPIQAPGDKPPQPLAENEWNKGTHANYVKVVERLDYGVGEILKALAAKNLANNTLVVFHSDNGGTKMARNVPLSGTKGGTFEGGIRVPCIVRWPGHLRAGTVSEQVGITMDLTASFVRIGGAKPPAGRTFDGMDIIQKLEAGTPPEARTLFWRIRRGENVWRAVREGNWKLVSKQTGPKREEFLFDLAVDIGEKQDLAASRPADFQRLKEKLAKWEVEVKPTR